MCGIVGYIGEKNAVPIIIESLKFLEYRGYDSAGLVILAPGSKDFEVTRCRGKVADLEFILENDKNANLALGHTRWATHGMPSEENAHPHRDCSGKIVVVHNGIVENYIMLKELLLKEGHKFKSETDTEVIVHLIEHNYKGDIFEAVRRTVSMIEGSYALGVLHCEHPDVIIAAKKQSPLIIGVGENENFIASDIPAILKYTKNVIYLEDDQLAIIKKHEVILKDRKGKNLDKKIDEVTWDPEMAQKGGYDHFMLKEIFEQPRAIRDTWQPRISEDEGKIFIKEMGLEDDEIRAINRIVIVSCGTSWHSGLIGRIFIERFTGIPVSVEYASEFRYSKPILDKNVLTISISQSGETADTLAAIRDAKKRGSKVISICNVFGSSIARESDGVIYTYAGPEIGVASTKAFTSQIVVLCLFALCIGRIRRTLLIPETLDKIEALRGLEEKILKVL